MKRKANKKKVAEIPPYNEAENCIELRKLSKTGRNLSKEEHDICSKMFKKFPEWYTETEERVFNETVPFGSNARYKK